MIMSRSTVTAKGLPPRRPTGTVAAGLRHLVLGAVLAALIFCTNVGAARVLARWAAMDACTAALTGPIRQGQMSTEDLGPILSSGSCARLSDGDAARVMWTVAVHEARAPLAW